jgi:hypothetical protein
MLSFYSTDMCSQMSVTTIPIGVVSAGSGWAHWAEYDLRVA